RSFHASFPLCPHAAGRCRTVAVNAALAWFSTTELWDDTRMSAHTRATATTSPSVLPPVIESPLQARPSRDPYDAEIGRPSRSFKQNRRTRALFPLTGSEPRDASPPGGVIHAAARLDGAPTLEGALLIRSRQSPRTAPAQARRRRRPPSWNNAMAAVRPKP